MDIYKAIRELSKTNKWQNLFSASKEISSIHLFKNVIDFSKLQEIFLNYLYTHDTILKDIIIDGINKIVLTDDVYVDSYMLWRKDNKYKKEQNKPQPPSGKNLHLVPGKKVIFPKKNKEAK